MYQKKFSFIIAVLSLLVVFAQCNKEKDNENGTTAMKATTDNGSWLVLEKEDLAGGTYHTRHAELFGKYVDGYNELILQAIDKVQATAPDGGGYFIGITAEPPESPIGYELKLFGNPLLTPPRTTSYCSGSSYTAFIEALNLLYADSEKELSDQRIEALRMQEPDGGRREDHIKFWGKWNADGYGNHFALVQYSGMGTVIEPNQARPGDFLNISWKSGNGHSVIFLGWYIDEKDEKNVVYWSSQKGTNGLGDDVVPISRINEVMFVRLTKPEKLYEFDVNTTTTKNADGSKIDW